MQKSKLSKLGNIVSETSSSEMMYSATSQFQVGGGFDMTPIFDMIKNGHFEQFIGLINKDLDFYAKDEFGNTIMHLLILNIDKFKKYPNFANVFKKLLKKMTKTELNIQNKDGNTILHLAVLGGEHGIASELISAGIDRNIKNNDKLRVVSTTTKSEIVQKPLMTNNVEKLNEILNQQTESSHTAPEIKKGLADLIARGAPPINLEISASTPDIELSRQFNVDDITSTVASSVKNFFENTSPTSVENEIPKIETGGFNFEKQQEFVRRQREKMKHLFKRNKPVTKTFSQTSPEPVQSEILPQISPVKAVPEKSPLPETISATSDVPVDSVPEKSSFPESTTSNTDILSTETFVGGVLGKKIGGSRRLKDFDDDDFDFESDYYQSGGKTDVMRLLNSRRDEIHEHTKQLIKENMEKITGKDLTEQEVLNIVSYLYKKMRKENPELLGEGKGLDRAVVVESMASNMEILENIDKRELEEIIESKRKHFEEKSQSQERRPRKETSTSSMTTSKTTDTSEEKPKKKRTTKKKSK